MLGRSRGLSTDVAGYKVEVTHWESVTIYASFELELEEVDQAKILELKEGKAECKG